MASKKKDGAGASSSSGKEKQQKRPSGRDNAAAKNLDSLVARLRGSPEDFVLQRTLLRTLRKDNIRRPDLVLEFAPKLLKKSGSLGNEAWTVQEQLFIAALDTNNRQIAEEVMEKLQKNFPSSSIRVRRLKGMKKEAEGRYEEAEAIYKEILLEEPTDSFAMKRRICVWKAQKETKKAIEELNDYLKIFMADVGAWQELGDLYLDQQQYEYAAFCYEELIVADPLNYHYHTRYAEILATMGDFTTARKYFAHSLELHPDNLRGLYGLCVAIATKKGGTKPKDNSDLYTWAEAKLRTKYKDAPAMLPLVESLLKQLKP